MARGRRAPSRNSNTMLSIMVVQALTQFMKLEQKPPVTVALILINALIFFRPGDLVEIVPSVAEICLNPYLVLKNRDWKRLLLSAFMHADEAHLTYNMVSFLWKGVQLEGALGSAQFAKLIALLTLLSQGCTLLVAKLIADQLGIREPFYHQCAVGFSGVIFALKVVLTWHSPTSSTIAGFIIPTRYAAWAELVAIQYATPQASFVGHLGGILAGLILVYFPRILPRGLPFVVGLRALAPTTVASVQSGRVEEQQAPQRRTRWFSSWGTAGSTEAHVRDRGNAGLGQTGSQEGSGLGAGLRSFFTDWINPRSTQVEWSCPACTFRNRGEADFCEMCGEAGGTTSGMHQRTPSAVQQSDASDGYERVSPAESIRRRRSERFGETSTARR
ncbi:hypothetical protein KFL_002830220 [Klebsormidium nitens]|uniref:RanBP2-type domain-containing protein n=1 Tax=Klebsormidium nitens TaxID=105231 RepID=A0A1Y1I5W3_KLENI|nr:hypothetical protein KFL_002830220 [Klebsormidium nitens]|eukprot:GAQ86345.1 hypothetical protein KFL_002830220 [Klebsormidium nitens]